MPETYEQRIERVARAIYEGHWGKVSDAVWPDIWRREKEITYLEKQARAADAISFAAGHAEADKFVTREQLAQDAMEIGRSEGFAAALEAAEVAIIEVIEGTGDRRRARQAIRVLAAHKPGEPT